MKMNVSKTTADAAINAVTREDPTSVCVRPDINWTQMEGPVKKVSWCVQKTSIFTERFAMNFWKWGGEGGGVKRERWSEMLSTKVMILDLWVMSKPRALFLMTTPNSPDVSLNWDERVLTSLSLSLSLSNIYEQNSSHSQNGERGSTL